MPSSSSQNDIAVALIGFGYWGPNLARNFSRQRECRLAAICDVNPERLEQARENYPGAALSSDAGKLMDNPNIDAILIATPVSTHFALARQALMAGKDILVEKPLTSTAADAEILVNLAREKGCILAVDHTFLYTGAVRKIADIVRDGGIGELIYLDSVRVNLGLFQHDVSVIYDLATHDLSIMSFLVSEEPFAVQATGVRYGAENVESIAHIHLEYLSGLIVNCHVNWLSPVKIRKTLIGGSNKMIVYDDMSTDEKVKIYDKGIIISETDPGRINRMKVEYRMGDMVTPQIGTREALDLETEEFLNCIRSRKRPVSDGELGLRVVRQLEGCSKSIAGGGTKIVLGEL